MSTVPPSATPVAPVAMSASTTVKVEDQVPGTQEASQTANGSAPPINWESEIQLVSSLAKLQELERKVSVEPAHCSPAPFNSIRSRHLWNTSNVTHHTDSARFMKCATWCPTSSWSH